RDAGDEREQEDEQGLDEPGLPDEIEPETIGDGLHGRWRIARGGRGKHCRPAEFSRAVDSPTGRGSDRTRRAHGRAPRAGPQSANRSSRNSPSFRCTTRSEKLKRTASTSASCRTVRQLGTTKTSRGPHSRTSPSTMLRPRPSTGVKTVASVER